MKYAVHERTNSAWRQLYEVSRLETESKRVVVKGWGEEGKGSQCLVGVTSVWEDQKTSREKKKKKLLEMDSYDDSTAM